MDESDTELSGNDSSVLFDSGVCDSCNSLESLSDSNVSFESDSLTESNIETKPPHKQSQDLF